MTPRSPKISRSCALLALAAALVLMACGGSGEVRYSPLPGEGAPTTPSTLRFVSSTDGSHTHEVTLTASEVTRPPAGGVDRQTTRTFGHFHRVRLSEAELRAIGAGRTVVKETTTSDGHSHRFRFVLP